MSGDYQANPGVSVTITTFTIGSEICRYVDFELSLWLHDIVELQLPYRAFTTGIGADVMSPGLVQDGTKCASDQVCLSQECVSVSQITTQACEAASNGLICSGNGVNPSISFAYRCVYHGCQLTSSFP